MRNVFTRLRRLSEEKLPSIPRYNKPSSFFKPFIQPKLTINQPNDAYEQEADAMADKVMRMPVNNNESTFFKPAFSYLQRKCSACDAEDKQLHRKELSKQQANENNPFEEYVDNLDNTGKPLPHEVRAFYEPRFGYDFSSVKIHTDSIAAKSAQSINALAYTVGNNIIFNNGEHSPETEKGKKLLGHELTHVIQQEQIPSGFIQRQPNVQGTLQPLGPQAQAQADCVSALKRTAERVHHAIYNRDLGLVIPHDVDEALTRFFPGSNYDSLEDLLLRIEPMADWLPDISLHKIPQPVPLTDPDYKRHVAAVTNDVPAQAFPPGSVNGAYIALYEKWYNEDFKSTRLLHEAYHYSFPTMGKGHPKKKPWENPVAIQGFVSVLGGLPMPKNSLPDIQYPP